MISADLLLKLIKAFAPLTIIIAVCIAIGVSSKKNQKTILPDQLSGMRSPTTEEANLILLQVLPRSYRTLIVSSLIFVPIISIVAGVIIHQYTASGLVSVISLGCLLLGLLCMYIGFISLPLSDISALRKKRYSVCECLISDIQIYTSYRTKLIPVSIHHAVIKDQKGYIWETDLPKDLQKVTEGTKCLVIIFDSEEKINSSRKNGRYVFKRQVFVP